MTPTGPDPAELLLRADTVVADGVHAEPGWIRIRDGVVVATGTDRRTSATGTDRAPHTSIHAAESDLGDRVVVPGFVDMHVHGGGGGSFIDADATQARVALRTHRTHGTTTSVASLVTASPDDLLAGVRVLADLVEQGELAGIHLEGPWLSPQHRGAHDAALLRDPDPREIDALFTASRGTITMVTLAPELPGGPDAVRRVCDHGALAAVGHTGATYEQARDAVRAGVRVATHLFNGMRVVHHRDPGPVLALCEDDRVVLELIMDGTHVHPAIYRTVCGVGERRLALVTDAMAAAGMPDGRYRLGTLDVEVRDGIATLAGTGTPTGTGTPAGTIAGSTATMDRVFATAVAASARSPADALVAAARQASAVPAAALGLHRTGWLRPGAHADLVVLDPGLRVEAVMKAGRWAV